MVPNEDDVKILLVDDDKVFVMSVQRALRKMKLPNEQLIAQDGGVALSVLRDACAEGQGVLPPIIVLLDVHMPRMDGWEFLKELEEETALAPLGLFVFATPEIKDRMSQKHGDQISGFLRKDEPTEGLNQALSMIQQSAPESYRPQA